MISNWPLTVNGCAAFTSSPGLRLEIAAASCDAEDTGTSRWTVKAGRLFVYEIACDQAVLACAGAGVGAGAGAGAGAGTGAGASTDVVGDDVAEPEPRAFDAVTLTRTVAPLSVVVSA